MSFLEPILETGEELLTGSRVTQKQPLKSLTHSYMDENPSSVNFLRTYMLY